MQIYDFTIIVPLYNEADNMPELERRLSAYLDTCSMKACVLFVDDGSSDGSLDCLKAMCSRHGNFRYISFGHNCGLSTALKAGFDYADSPYIGYIDADLQTYPEDFEKLLPYIREYDMVTGIPESLPYTCSPSVPGLQGNAQVFSCPASSSEWSPL